MRCARGITVDFLLAACLPLKRATGCSCPARGLNRSPSLPGGATWTFGSRLSRFQCYRSVRSYNTHWRLRHLVRRLSNNGGCHAAGRRASIFFLPAAAYQGLWRSATADHDVAVSIPGPHFDGDEVRNAIVCRDFGAPTASLVPWCSFCRSKASHCRLDIVQSLALKCESLTRAKCSEI